LRRQDVLGEILVAATILLAHVAGFGEAPRIASITVSGVPVVALLRREVHRAISTVFGADLSLSVWCTTGRKDEEACEERKEREAAHGRWG
jgi:hypothetical protein